MKVKYCGEVFMRPLRRVYPLEIISNIKQFISQNLEKMLKRSSGDSLEKIVSDRSGRIV